MHLQITVPKVFCLFLAVFTFLFLKIYCYLCLYFPVFTCVQEYPVPGYRVPGSFEPPNTVLATKPMNNTLLTIDTPNY